MAGHPQAGLFGRTFLRENSELATLNRAPPRGHNLANAPQMSEKVEIAETS